VTLLREVGKAVAIILIDIASEYFKQKLREKLETERGQIGAVPPSAT